ncbi:hypothetical protein ACLIBG_15155 [Virgibacillus sp. W0181]|uniref:hypothetical protein n=1 Tax=Virgibacillus sp. W0181 TaxID=3391581 RepID=UPI003F45C8B3
MRFLIPFLLAAVILSGCSSMMQNSDKDKGEAIIKFINEDVQEANDYQEESANILNSLILSNQEEATIHDKLKSEAIPKAEKAVDIVKDIDIPISELEEPHTLLETAITDFAGALELVAEVMVSNDAAVEKKADKKFQSYEQSLEKYHSSIAEVAKEFGIEYEKSGLENSTSLPTDVNESNSGTSPGQQAVITFINEDVSSFSSK